MCGVCGFNSSWVSSDAFRWLRGSSVILIISPCEHEFGPEVVEYDASSLTKSIAIVDASTASSNIVGSSSTLGSSIVLSSQLCS